MSRQIWARGVWGIAVAVASGAVAIAALPQQGQNDPQQHQQQQPQEQTFARTANNHAMAGRNNLDHYFVKVLDKANKDEIEMGRLAEQRSQNPAVKQLAKQMVEDHTRFMSKLDAIKGTERAPSQARFQRRMQGRAAFRSATDNTTNQQPQQQQQVPAQQQPGIAGNTNQPGFAGNAASHQGMAAGEHGTAAQFAKVMEEVDRNMQQSLMQELSSKQGAQFDHCFLTGQLFGHIWVVNALKTFERDASPELKPILQEGLQASEQHLAHVKTLLAQLGNEKQAGANTSNQSVPNANVPGQRTNLPTTLPPGVRTVR